MTKNLKTERWHSRQEWLLDQSMFKPQYLTNPNKVRYPPWSVQNGTILFSCPRSILPWEDGTLFPLLKTAEDNGPGYPICQHHFVSKTSLAEFYWECSGSAPAPALSSGSCWEPWFTSSIVLFLSDSNKCPEFTSESILKVFYLWDQIMARVSLLPDEIGNVEGIIRGSPSFVSFALPRDWALPPGFLADNMVSWSNAG